MVPVSDGVSSAGEFHPISGASGERPPPPLIEGVSRPIPRWRMKLTMMIGLFAVIATLWGMSDATESVSGRLDDRVGRALPQAERAWTCFASLLIAAAGLLGLGVARSVLSAAWHSAGIWLAFAAASGCAAYLLIWFCAPGMWDLLAT